MTLESDTIDATLESTPESTQKSLREHAGTVPRLLDNGRAKRYCFYLFRDFAFIFGVQYFHIFTTSS